MISTLGLWIIGFAINYAHTFRTIPFKWDSRVQMIPLQLCSRDLASCRHNYYLLWVHELFIVARFVESILRGRVLPLPLIIMDLIYIFICLFPCVFLFLLRDKTLETVTFINQYTRYFRELQVKYPLQTSNRPKIWELLLVVLTIFVVVQPFMFLSICYRHPALTPLFLPSLLDPWLGAQSALVYVPVFFLGSLDAWYFTVFCSFAYFIVCTMTVYLFTAVEILQKMSLSLDFRAYVKHVVDDLAVWAVEAVSAMRCFQLLTQIMNFIVRDCIYIGEINALAFFVFQLFILGLHWRVLHLPYIVMYTVGLFAVTPYLLVSNEVLASYNQASLRLLHSLTTFDSALGMERSLFARYVQSTRPCRIEMGLFGHYNRKKKIKMAGNMVYYVSRLIMLTQ